MDCYFLPLPLRSCVICVGDCFKIVLWQLGILQDLFWGPRLMVFWSFQISFWILGDLWRIRIDRTFLFFLWVFLQDLLSKLRSFGNCTRLCCDPAGFPPRVLRFNSVRDPLTRLELVSDLELILSGIFSAILFRSCRSCYPSTRSGPSGSMCVNFTRHHQYHQDLFAWISPGNIRIIRIDLREFHLAISGSSGSICVNFTWKYQDHQDRFGVPWRGIIWWMIFSVRFGLLDRN